MFSLNGIGLLTGPNCCIWLSSAFILTYIFINLSNLITMGIDICFQIIDENDKL